jgi:hypothetical protein
MKVKEAIGWGIFRALALVAYLALINWLPAGRDLDRMLPLLLAVGMVAWWIWRR